MAEQANWKDFSDLNFDELSYEEGLAEESINRIDAFYGSLNHTPAVEAHHNAESSAPVQQEGDAAAPIETHDEFADLMNDIETLPDAIPDAPLDGLTETPVAYGTVATTAPLHDPFGIGLNLATPDLPTPGPWSFSPLNGQNGTIGVLGRVPPAPPPEAPSSGNRSLMHAEMRQEEDLQSSPFPGSPGPPLSSLKQEMDLDSAGNPNVVESAEDSDHMLVDVAPSATFKDRLLSAKSSRAQPPSSNEGSNSQQQAEDSSAGLIANESTPQPDLPESAYDPNITGKNSDTSPLANPQHISSTKRHRDLSPSAMLSPARSQTDETSPKRPPVKKQKSKASKMSTPEDEKEGTKTQADGQSDSLSPSKQSLAPVIKDVNMAATPEASEGAKKEVTDENEPGAVGTISAEELAPQAEEGNEGDMSNSRDEFDGNNPVMISDDSSDTDTDKGKKGAKKKGTKAKVNPKAKGKKSETPTTATKLGKTESAEQTPNENSSKRSRIGGNELKDLIGSSVMKGVRKMDNSPRKTRKERQDEENAKPNAAGAAKRRQSAGMKK